MLKVLYFLLFSKSNTTKFYEHCVTKVGDYSKNSYFETIAEFFS